MRMWNYGETQKHERIGDFSRNDQRSSTQSDSTQSDEESLQSDQRSATHSDQSSFDSIKAENGSHLSEEEDTFVKCTLLLKSGKVLTIAYPKMGDKRLSMGFFFHLAKTSLNLSECHIQLTIGRTTIPAQNAGKKIFLLSEVQDMIGEHGEVKINVMRVASQKKDKLGPRTSFPCA